MVCRLTVEIWLASSDSNVSPRFSTATGGGSGGWAHVVSRVEWWMANDVAKEGDESLALVHEEIPANGRNIISCPFNKINFGRHCLCR